MKFKVVTVEHRPPNPEDDETLDAFENAFTNGIEKFIKLNRSTIEKGPRQLRQKMLHRLLLKADLLITPEALFKIHDVTSAKEGQTLIKNICEEIYAFLELELTRMSGLRLRGRSRQFSNRDRLISRMRRDGFSYGSIGDKLDIKRNAVQAAYLRDRKRRDFFCKSYPELKRILAVVGIILRETKSAD